MDFGFLFVVAFLGLFVGASIYNAIKRRGSVHLRNIQGELDDIRGGGTGDTGGDSNERTEDGEDGEDGEDEGLDIRR